MRPYYWLLDKDLLMGVSNYYIYLIVNIGSLVILVCYLRKAPPLLFNLGSSKLKDSSSWPLVQWYPSQSNAFNVMRLPWWHKMCRSAGACGVCQSSLTKCTEYVLLDGCTSFACSCIFSCSFDEDGGGCFRGLYVYRAVSFHYQALLFSRMKQGKQCLWVFLLVAISLSVPANSA